MITKGFSHAHLSIKLIHFEELERFLDEIQTLWVKRLNDIDKQAKEIEDEEHRQEFYEYYYDDWVVYRDDYPRIAKYSVLLSSYSYFEKLCLDYYRTAIKKNNELVESRSRKLHALDYVNWFRDNFGKNIIPKYTYKKFIDINQVRNRIVHSNGKVDRDNNKGVVQIVSQSTLLELNDYNEIEMNEGYIKDVMSVLSELVTKIHHCVYKER